MEDLLLSFGGDVKARPDGSIGGLLVRYSKSSAPDLAGDYFDAETDFGFEDSIKTPIYLNHRLPLDTPDGGQITVKSKIGEGTLTKGEEGILIEAILFNRKRYEKALASMGWSSGTARHLTDRTKVGKAYHVDSWPLGLDASITPEPCDPSNICELKSYKSAAVAGIEIEATDPAKHAATSLAAKLNQLIDDRVDDGLNRADFVKRLARDAALDSADIERVLSGDTRRPINATLKAFARVLEVDFEVLKSIADSQYGELKSIKGMFEEELAGRTPSSWELRNVLCCVIKRIAEAAKASAEAGVQFDAAGKVREAFSEYARRDESAITAQVLAYASGEMSDGMMEGEGFYLKALTDPTEDDFISGKHIAIKDHSSLAVSAFKSIVARFWANHEARVKAGRVLSDKNRTELQSVRDSVSALVTRLDDLLEATKPMATDMQKRAAMSNHLRQIHKARQIGAPAN